MRLRPLQLLSALCACGLFVGAAHALTIYRIGGEDLPPPAAVEEDPTIEFVQLSWNVDEKKFGLADLVEITPNSIAPQRLDPEENLTPLIRGRGGLIKTNDGYGWKDEPQLDNIFDADSTTAYVGLGGQYSTGGRKGIWIDLGGAFPIRRIKFYPTPRFWNERFVENFIIGTNDGDDLKKGTREGRFTWRGQAFIDYDIHHNITENTQSDMEVILPDVPVRNILFVTGIGNWEIAEYQVFGDGFAQEARYSTDIIPLGGPSTLGDLKWAGAQDSVAKVDLTMRSGDDTDPNYYWRFTFRGNERSRFAANGRELTSSTYNRLESGEKGGVSPDHENWDFWAPPVDFESQQADFTGSKPREFVQFKADFSSTSAASGGRIDFLQFSVTQPPVASQVLAEIDPPAAQVSESTRFTYKVFPMLESDDLGFDSIEIKTPIKAGAIEAVRIDGVEQEFDIARWDDSGFEVKIPRIDIQKSNELVEVVFEAEVFKVGTIFEGKVFDSEHPFEVRQRVAAGDADPLVDSNSLSVSLATVAQESVRALRLTSPVFTPNGDGANDELQIEYDLVNLSGAVPVVISLYDLSGRLVGEVFRGTAASGRFNASWDGTDASGQIVPPGLYVLSLEAQADRKKDTAVRLVSLVY